MNMLSAMLVLWSGITAVSVAATALVVWLNVRIDAAELQAAAAAPTQALAAASVPRLPDNAAHAKDRPRARRIQDP